jgi:DNA helicase-2/ATP-dependent DNA helicase PcrA
MDVSDIFDALNDRQREAVAAPPGNMLIVAGAGSGKTRVLAHRIAYLIRTGQATPHSILAVTFTNKAAREMRERIERMLDMPVRQMWVGTFHGIAHRLLRAHWREAGLPQTFQILDAEDQQRTIRRVMKQLEIDDARWPPKQVQWFINGQKDEGRRPEHVDDHGDIFQKTMIRIYTAYEEQCQRAGLVDFAELLFRAHELWLQHPDLLAHYQQRFKHILVDEFQDTNAIQYAWLRVLAGDRIPLFAVGDDDQSIYGWRGARIENIQRFTDDFRNTQVIRLEQNYRSTGTILDAANALIACNTGRLGKELWTDGEDGEPIRLYAAYNDLDEARYIVDTIQQYIERGHARSDMAILYRSNAQSRVLEEALMRAGLPYRVYGGMRFFERAEIKHALAYLRLIANRADDASFERVVNTPTRGIGERTVQAVRDEARNSSVSMWQAAHTIVEQKLLNARAVNALKVFLDLIDAMAAACDGIELREQVEHVIHASTLVESYRKDKGEKAQMRVDNLEELISAARQFEHEEEGLDDLGAFLVHAALEAGEGQAAEHEDPVQLMTLHTAKGLEFDIVFLSGLEEGLFPHRMSMDEPGRLEEERRLCYVGMTRARKNLYLSYAEVRRLHGSETYTQASRFLGEIPREYLDEVRVQSPVTSSTYTSTPASMSINESGYSLGQRVMHAKFGEGIVMNCEGSGAHARVQVNFDGVGSKWLVVAYANLQSL